MATQNIQPQYSSQGASETGYTTSFPTQQYGQPPQQYGQPPQQYSPPPQQYSPPPPQYNPQQYSPPQYNPQQYSPPQYNPQQYSPPQYNPQQYNPPQVQIQVQPQSLTQAPPIVVAAPVPEISTFKRIINIILILWMICILITCIVYLINGNGYVQASCSLCCMLIIYMIYSSIN